MKLHTLYHSRDWDRLVEQGWITAYTFVNPCDGCHIAVLIKLETTAEGAKGD